MTTAGLRRARAAAAVLWLVAVLASAAGTWRLARATPGLGGPSAAAAPGSVRPVPAERVTVVLAQGLAWADLQLLVDAAAEGGFGGAGALVSVVTGGSPLPGHAYLTAGAGTPAVLPQLAVPPLEAGESWHGEPAGTLYARLTGKPPGDARVLVPALAQVAAANRDRSPPVVPGWLGQQLALRGLRTAVLGSADLPGERDGRWAALLAADAQGLVPYGRLRGLARVEPGDPAGVVQDWARIVAAWRSLPADTALAVVESGDLLRLQSLRQLLPPERYDAARAAAIQRLAAGLNRLLAAARQRAGRQPVWLLAPAAGGSGQGVAQGFGLLWIWDDAGPSLNGARPVAAGMSEPAQLTLLTSASTRRRGVVTLTDVAPSILNELGLPAPAALGRPVMPEPAGVSSWRAASAAGASLAAELVDNHASRVPLIKGYVLLVIVNAAAALAALRWPALGRGVAWIAPGVAAVPLAYLLLPGLGLMGTTARAAAALLLALAAAVLATGLPTRRVFLALSGLTAAAVVADLLLGAPAVIRSPLGFSLLVGARFYGIGNEYAGLLVGAAALAAGLAADAARSRLPGEAAAGAGAPGAGAPVHLAAAVVLAAGLLLMAPGLGANFGCGAAALAAAFAFYVRGMPARRRPAALWQAGAAALAAGAAAVAFDLLAGPAATHVGRAAQNALAGDWSPVLEIARRKVLLNLRLIRYTIWSRVFVASLLVVTALVLRPVAGLRNLSVRRPGFYAGVVAAVVGALAALVLNDSGVVAAATAMILPMAAVAHELLADARRDRKAEDEAHEVA